MPPSAYFFFQLETVGANTPISAAIWSRVKPRSPQAKRQPHGLFGVFYLVGLADAKVVIAETAPSRSVLVADVEAFFRFPG